MRFQQKFSSPIKYIFLLMTILTISKIFVYGVSGSSEEMTTTRRGGRLFRRLKEIGSSNSPGDHGGASGNHGGARSSATTSSHNLETLQLLAKTFGHAPPSAGNGEHLDPELLFAKMEGGFNSEHQSITKPPNLGQVVKILPLHNGGENWEHKGTGHRSKGKGTVPRSIDTMIPVYVEQFLRDLAYCPLAAKWIDLGEYLWPRYFKFTNCIRKKCSYPEGLYCKPAPSSKRQHDQGEEEDDSKKPSSLRIPMLYWTCLPPHLRHRKKEGGNQDGGREGGSKKNCGSWSKIYVTVVDQCVCSGCDGGGSRKNR